MLIFLHMSKRRDSPAPPQIREDLVAPPRAAEGASSTGSGHWSETAVSEGPLDSQDQSPLGRWMYSGRTSMAVQAFLSSCCSGMLLVIQRIRNTEEVSPGVVHAREVAAFIVLEAMLFE